MGLLAHMVALSSLRNLQTAFHSPALHTIAKTWNQPRCPSTVDWIKKIWYIYTVEYYAAIKKNNIMPFAWRVLEVIILRRLTHEQKMK